MCILMFHTYKISDIEKETVFEWVSCVDIKHMKYFVEVVRQGGMTNASKSLFIAQPTISKAIKDIEGEMAVPLFDREKRQLY